MTTTAGPPITPFSPGFEANPYPTYAWLREHMPVYPAKLPFANITVWLVTRYDDVQRVLTDPRFSNDDTRWASPEFRDDGLVLCEGTDFERHMSTVDPPTHTRLRRMVVKTFTPRRVQDMRRSVEEFARKLLIPMANAGTCDLLADFAGPLSMNVLCQLLGVPSEERVDLRQWVDTFLSTDDVERKAIQPALLSLDAYLTTLLEQKRRHLTDDLISSLIMAQDEDGSLTQTELKGMIFLILAAGYEGTMNLFGNGLLALLDFPQQLQLLRRSPELIETAIEELVRYDGPTATPIWRFTKEPVTLSGTTLPTRAPVMAALGSANRDPQYFPNPDVLDIERKNTHHLGFGHGIHYCLGAALPRMEAKVALPMILELFPDIALAIPREQIRFQPAIISRGLYSLPLRLKN